MRHQYRQEVQMPISDKPVIKGDHKLFRIQNPIRTELSLSLFFLLKGYIIKSVEKVAKKHPQVTIIYGKAGGSWWKPEYRIVIGGKNKKAVEAATEAMQNTLNNKKDKKPAK